MRGRQILGTAGLALAVLTLASGGVASGGILSGGTGPLGMVSGDVVQSGVVPGGTVSGGVVQGGAVSGGIASSGTGSVGVVRDGVVPGGIVSGEAGSLGVTLGGMGSVGAISGGAGSVDVVRDGVTSGGAVSAGTGPIGMASVGVLPGRVVSGGRLSSAMGAVGMVFGGMAQAASRENAGDAAQIQTGSSLGKETARMDAVGEGGRGSAKDASAAAPTSAVDPGDARLAGLPSAQEGLRDGLAPDAAPPQRVVSMNLCTDQLAMMLAAPGQLISVSALAADPVSSAMVAQAQSLHLNRGQAEEIAFLQPDLVLAGRYTTAVTVQMLQRLGYRVEIFEPENSLQDITTNLRLMGRLLGQETKAEALIGRLQDDLAQLAALALLAQDRAAVYYGGGYTSGQGSLGDEMMKAIGLRNIAGEMGYPLGGVVALEALILAGPDVLIRGQSYRIASRSEEMLQHPALSQMLAAGGQTAETGPEWACGTPLTIDVMHKLAVQLRGRQDD